MLQPLGPMSTGRWVKPIHCPSLQLNTGTRDKHSRPTNISESPTETTTTTTSAIACKGPHLIVVNRPIFLEIFFGAIIFSVAAVVVLLLQLQQQGAFSYGLRSINFVALTGVYVDSASQKGTDPVLDLVSPEQLSTTTRTRLVARDQGKVTPHENTKL